MRPEAARPGMPPGEDAASWMMRVQPALEENDGREPIDRARAFFDADAAGAQDPPGFHAGEPLVVEIDGKAGSAAEPACEVVNPRRLTALGAAHVQWPSEEKQRNFTLARERGQRVDIFTNVRSLQCLEALCGDAQAIADGQADPTFPQVERQHAPRKRRRMLV